MVMPAIPASIRAPELDDAEVATCNRLLRQLRGYAAVNERQRLYHDAAQAVRDLGIAIPPHLTNLEAAIGWPAMVVAALHERLRHDGWSTADHGVPELVAANKLGREMRYGHRLAMQYGVAYGVASKGGDGEPDVVMTAESPQVMTATWDHRRKGVSEAVLVGHDDKGRADSITLWIGAQTFALLRDAGGWAVDKRSVSPAQRPTIVRWVNRYGYGPMGMSEITRPIRSLSDNAIRTIVAMEVSRDFHAAPKFWLLGASEEQFVGSDGKQRSAWETYIGRLNAIPRADPDDPVLPDVKQFSGASPQPFIEQLRALAQMVSSEGALPVSYMGVVHDANPASADAALVAEARLILRAEERQDDFGDDDGEFMRLAIWQQTGQDPGVTPMPIWRPASTPTMSAASDAATKLVQAGVLDADSEVTQRRVGLTEADRATLAAERRRNRSRDMLAGLSQAAAAVRQEPTVSDAA